MQSLEDAATTSRKATNDTTRTAASKGTRVLGCGNVTNGQAEAGKTALQRLLEAINEQRDEMREIIAEQRSMICELRDVVSRQEDAIQELHRQLADAKTQLSEELRPDRHSRTQPSLSSFSPDKPKGVIRRGYPHAASKPTKWSAHPLPVKCNAYSLHGHPILHD
jgi:chromosome segregation ATPase